MSALFQALFVAGARVSDEQAAEVLLELMCHDDQPDDPAPQRRENSKKNVTVFVHALLGDVDENTIARVATAMGEWTHDDEAATADWPSSSDVPWELAERQAYQLLRTWSKLRALQSFVADEETATRATARILRLVK